MTTAQDIASRTEIGTDAGAFCPFLSVAKWRKAFIAETQTLPSINDKDQALTVLRDRYQR